MANYPTSDPSFTTKTDGPSSTILAAHVNSMQDEIVAIGADLRARFPTGQVVFPATQSASAGANTLDDYEEGTWTPSLGGSATYTSRSGTYTKIGRLVHLSFEIVVNAIGTGSASSISGCPFTAAVFANGYVSWFASAALSPVFVTCFIEASATAITMAGLTGAATSMSSPLAIFGNSTRVDGTIVFHV